MHRIPVILVITLITTIFLVGFTYLAAPKPTQQSKQTIPHKITYNSLPKNFELVGKEGLIDKEQLIKAQTKTIVAIANLDALVVINQLKQHFSTDFDYITAANISQAPWLIKKMGVLPTLEKINANNTTPMIYDYNGWFAQSLNLKDIDPSKYFIYEITSKGDVLFLFDGVVPMGAMEGNITQEQTAEILQTIVNRLEAK
ncbi:MAG: hypothetical protein U9N30_09000 [Campylobacterota bacterium]|nr:hypothetical protein [Campylobacterota bacterium]